MNIDRSKLYVRSWYLWFIQNFLVFLSMFLYIGNYFSLIIISENPEFYLISRISLSIVLFIALLMDLVIVAMIVFDSAFKYRNSVEISQNVKGHLIISISGSMWIIISVVWRLPFFIRDLLNLGFEPTGLFTFCVHENIWFLLYFITGAFFLFIFLILQDIYLSLPGYSNIRMVYGLTNLIGNLLIAFYGLFGGNLIINRYINLTFFYWIRMVFWKLTLTPLVGMAVAEKIFTLEKKTRQNEKSYSSQGI